MASDCVIEDIRASVHEVLQDSGRDFAFEDTTSLVRGGDLCSMDLLAVLLSLEAKGYQVVGIREDAIDTVADIARHLLAA